MADGDAAVREYRSLVDQLDRCKVGRASTPKKSWPAAAIASYKAALERLLTAFPYLHGFWIKYARCLFGLGDTAAALDMYERAVASVPYACDLWTSYLEFLILVNSPQQRVLDTFKRAEALVGGHFLSHRLWDLYIRYIEEYIDTDPGKHAWAAAQVIQVLQHILRATTVHQFSKYFQYLSQLIEERRAGPEAFGADTNDPAEWNRILQRHRDLYVSQQDRVAAVWEYEKLLRRPFFHPAPLPAEQKRAWARYIDALEQPSDIEAVYHRALLVDALNEDLWMEFVRWLIASKADPRSAFEQACAVLPKELCDLRLYYALWLEYTESDEARDSYRKILDGRGKQHAVAWVQYARYVARTEGETTATTVLSDALADSSIAQHIKPLLVRELHHFDPTAFERFRLDDEPGYWREYLKAEPNRAAEIVDQAPEGAIDEDCLALLAGADVQKFLEYDSIMHRSALDEL